jgi:nucleotide-binding universal stress UspA family protein
VEKRAYRILVPIANPVIARKLISFAYIVAKARKGEVVILSVVKLPKQTPLSAGKKYVEEQKKLLKELMSELPEDVPFSGVLKVGHSIPEAILNTIEDEKADLVVLGWRGRTFRRDFILGSTIDPVLLKAPCDVAVARFEPGMEVQRIEKILIPTAGGPHAELAAEIARDIKEVTGARITLTYVAGDENERVRALRYIEETCKAAGEVDALIKISDDRVGAIAEESLKHDVVIIGATNETFLRNFIKGVFPEKLVKRTTKTGIMVRKKIVIRDLISEIVWWFRR